MRLFLTVLILVLTFFSQLPAKAETYSGEVDPNLVISNSDQEWWKALGEKVWESQSESRLISDVYLSRREAQTTIFSNYLSFLRQTAISLSVEEIRLRRLEAQGDINGDKVVFSVCSSSVYQQRNSHLVSSLGGTESNFIQAYCGLECIPPGGLYATYSPTSQSCHLEAAQIFQSFHSCDNDIAMWELAGFSNSEPRPIDPTYIDLSFAEIAANRYSTQSNPYSAADLDQAFFDQNTKCQQAKSDLSISSFDHSNPVISIPPRRNPEEYSSYEPASTYATTPLIRPEKVENDCMISQTETLNTRLDRLRDYYLTTMPGTFNDSFARYPLDTDMRAEALAMTDRYFERIFSQYNTGGIFQACMDSSDFIKPSNIGNFAHTSIGTFIDVISFTGQTGEENSDVKELLAKLDAIDRSTLNEDQLDQLQNILSRYSNDLSRDASISGMSGEIYGSVAAIFLPGAASRLMNQIRNIGVVSAEGKVLALMEKVSGLLSRPFLPGAQTGTLSVTIAKAEKLNPWIFTPTHKLTKSKTDYNKLYNQIAKDGSVKEPVKYVDFKGDKYIVDGHHRVQIAKKLNLSEVPAEEVQLPYGGYKTVADFFYQ